MKSLLFSMIMGGSVLNGCQTPADTEVWQPRLYIGSPEKQAIYRGQDRDTVECHDVRFQDFVCMSVVDMERMMSGCLK